MAREVRVPEVSENVTEGKVVTVLVSIGDDVEHDQSLLELETEKAVVAIPAPFAGRVVELRVADGDTIKVGDVIALIEEAGASAQRKPAKEKKKAAAQADVKPRRRAEALVRDDEEPRKAEEKEPEEPEEPEEEAEEGAPAAAEAAEAPEAATAPKDSAAGVAETPEPAAREDHTEEPAPAAPSIRRLARLLGVEIARVRGSGPRGRITEEDVQRHAHELVARGESTGAGRGSGGAPGGGPAPGAGPTHAPAPLPDFSRWGRTRREPLSQVRAITARTMTQAWTTIPQVTQFDEVDVTGLERFRTHHNTRLAKGQPRLTMTAILLKVVGLALRRFPRFNASLDAAAGEVVLKDYVHVSVAVDTERGLLVPVVRDVDRKGLLTLNAELSDLAERTRNKRVKPDELEGGNFSISNLGGIGGAHFTPIVYPPQVAILGVGRAVTRPVWPEAPEGAGAGPAAPVPALLMPLALTYDHRVIDGADGARFIRWLDEALAEPVRLLLDDPAAAGAPRDGE